MKNARPFDGEDRKIDLTSLDPGHSDPWYWSRMYEGIMTAVGPVLRRRQALSNLTIGDVVASWARTLVPVTLAAAMVAGIALFPREASVAGAGMSLEELFEAPAGGEEVPAALFGDDELPVVLAADIY